MEEAGVVGLAAGDGSRVDQGNALGSGFCAGQTARFGEQHVTGVHKQWNAVCEADGVDIGFFTEILAEAVAELGVAAADSEDFYSSALGLQYCPDEFPGLAESHAAGHYQIPAGTAVDVAAAGEEAGTFFPRCVFVHVSPAFLTDRDSERIQQLPAGSDGHAFLYKVGVGDDDAVHFEILHQSQRVVVGLDEDGSEAGWQQTGAAQGGHGLGREDVSTDDGGEAACKDVVAETLAVDLICHVNGGLDSARAGHDLACPVDDLYQIAFGGEDVQVRHRPGKVGADEREGVGCLAFYPVASAPLGQGLGRGVMSSAHVA